MAAEYPPETSAEPSGLKARVMISWWDVVMLRNSLPVSADHKRIVPSGDAPVATILPSGESTTGKGHSLLISILQSCLPVAASHSRMVLSPQLPETSL